MIERFVVGARYANLKVGVYTVEQVSGDDLHVRLWNGTATTLSVERERAASFVMRPQLAGWPSAVDPTPTSAGYGLGTPAIVEALLLYGETAMPVTEARKLAADEESRCQRSAERESI